VRALPPRADLALVLAQIEASPLIDRVRACSGDFAAATSDLVDQVLTAAESFAADVLAPLNTAMDESGCRLEGGRVRTAPGHKAAWDGLVEAAWPSLDAAPGIGGQGLPAIVALAVQSLFDRACPSFGMLPVPQRSAARLLTAHGSAEQKSTWLPRLASGEWGATICISEAEAGSDVARVRTLATPDPDGSWSITGEKSWISFGSHDLTDTIGHCLLARTADNGEKKGLSLFLVPDRIDGRANGVVVRRIEEKLGLHGSPTCALGFEGARAEMIGVEGRGLQQMFAMIANMRLSVGAMGLGIASAACDIAFVYARERRQGGRGPKPVPIVEHADVQRMLMSMAARVELLRGLMFALANQVELGAGDPDPVVRTVMQALSQWLLPIVKTLGGETAFDVASDAVQVLGGAGYTREWPVEQALRDARVLAVFEGTTGIQALDLVHRRLLAPDARGFDLFVAEARAVAAACNEGVADQLGRCVDMLVDAAERLRAMSDRRDVDAGATAFLQLAMLAATSWIAARLTMVEGDDPASRHLRAVSRFALATAPGRAAALRDEAVAGAARLDAMDWKAA
jgi:alkylation response protein AidB-like acyl-CoA dehydrogenase